MALNSQLNHYLFNKTDNGKFFALIVYVDDVLIIGNDYNDIVAWKFHLNTTFTIKNLGFVAYFLGVKITNSSAGTHLSQHKYIIDLLAETALTCTKPVDLPMHLGTTFHTNAGPLYFNPEQYQRLIGKLLYLNFTHPNITHAVNNLSQFIGAPYSSY